MKPGRRLCAPCCAGGFPIATRSDGEKRSTPTESTAKQTDVVIYDGFNSPLIFHEQDSPAIFPVEGVYGFIEVKSKLTLESMVDSWNKAISLYTLDRQEFSHPLGGVTITGKYKPFSAAFAFDGPKDLTDLTRTWGDLATNYPPEARLNMICILGRGCLMYVSEDCVWSLGNFPKDAPTLVQTGGDSLLMFMLSAWTAMGEAPSLRIPNPMAYAGGTLKYDVLIFGRESPRS